MIELKLAGRDRKTAIIGGIVVLGLLVVARGAPLWYRWRSNTAESASVAFAEAMVTKETINRAREIDVANKRADLQRMEIAPAFVGGSGAAAVAATLASVVADAAGESGLRMGALQATGDSVTGETGGVGKVRVRGEASGDVAGVTRFLAVLESGFPLVAVRELSLTQTQANASADQPELLRVEFVIEGLSHIEQAEERK